MPQSDGRDVASEQKMIAEIILFTEVVHKAWLATLCQIVKGIIITKIIVLGELRIEMVSK